MTSNDSKSYFNYLNKLVDPHNNTYHHSFNKQPIGGDFFSLHWKKNEANRKAAKFKVNDRVRISKYKNILVMVTLKIGPEKYLLSILFWNQIFGCIKDLNKEKIIMSLY